MAVLIPLLTKFDCLVELNLENNGLTTLPSSLSSLLNLKSLNIANNLFENLTELISILKELPCLEDLQVNIEQREEVMLIITKLNNLKTLNGQCILFLTFSNRRRKLRL